MINIPIMSRKDIVDIIEADDIVISSRHEPEIQRTFVVQIIPP